MENRELGLLEIVERIKAAKTAGTISIKTFKRNPTSGVEAKDLPCIFMLEDVDKIVEYSGRSSNGYPAKRSLEIILEMITDDSVDIRTLYRKVRASVFSAGVQVAEGVFIKETRTEGPTGYNIPDILGMRLVMDLNYNDEGIIPDL